MTVIEAIELLQKVRDKHGDGIEVYFDCPFCDKSFTPNTVQKEAVHLTADVSPIDGVEQ